MYLKSLSIFSLTIYNLMFKKHDIWKGKLIKLFLSKKISIKFSDMKLISLMNNPWCIQI